MKITVVEDLAPKETILLSQCEDKIQNGGQQVAEGLWTIYSNNLYRGTHAGIIEYAMDRWGFGKAYAYRVIKAKEVQQQLESVPDAPKITAISQLAELAKAKAADRVVVLEQATERAAIEDREVTAADIAVVVSDAKHSTAKTVQTSAQKPAKKPKVGSSKSEFIKACKVARSAVGAAIRAVDAVAEIAGKGDVYESIDQSLAAVLVGLKKMEKGIK